VHRGVPGLDAEAHPSDPPPTGLGECLPQQLAADALTAVPRPHGEAELRDAVGHEPVAGVVAVEYQRPDHAHRETLGLGHEPEVTALRFPRDRGGISYKG
jgi:hypothetical protein